MNCGPDHLTEPRICFTSSWIDLVEGVDYLYLDLHDFHDGRVENLLARAIAILCCGKAKEPHVYVCYSKLCVRKVEGKVRQTEKT